MKQHFQQIDVIKGIAIVMVLLLHSLPRPALLESYAVFHIWQAVPLFMVVMGLNLGLSAGRKEQHLPELYTRDYFTKKASRIIRPFLLIFILSILAGLVWKVFFEKDVLEFGWYTLAGVLPVTGKGNYFITLLLQSILLLPIIGYGFSRKPVLTTVLLVVMEVLFQLWAKQVAYFDVENYLYDAALPRYFSAIAYGLWLSYTFRGYKTWLFALPLVLLAAGGAIYLWLVTYEEVALAIIRPEWNTQHLLTFGYAASLVWVGLRLFPSSSGAFPLKMLSLLGKASYHIFLVQVLYFGLAENDTSLWLNLGTCLLLGFLFYKLEGDQRSFPWRRRIFSRKQSPY